MIECRRREERRKEGSAVMSSSETTIEEWSVALYAHFADRDQSFRSIVITRFGDRDRSGATLDLV